MIQIGIDTVYHTFCRWDGTELPTPIERKARIGSKVGIKFFQAGVPYTLVPGNTGAEVVKTQQGNRILALSTGWALVDGAYISTLSLLTDEVVTELGLKPYLLGNLEVKWTEPGVDERSESIPFLIKPPVSAGVETSPGPAAPPYPEAAVVQQAIEEIVGKQPYRAELEKLGVQGADLPSSSSMDLGAATGEFVKITGTAGIDTCGVAAAGIRRVVLFDDVTILTASSDLLLPRNNDYTTTAGGICVFRSLGAGVWKMEGNLPQSGVTQAVQAAIDAAINGFAIDATDIDPATWLFRLNFFNKRSSILNATTATLADIPNLVSPTMPINTTYHFRAELDYDASSDPTAGQKYAVRVPGTAPSLLAQVTALKNSTGSTVISSRLTSSGASAGQDGSAVGHTVITGWFTTGSGSSGTMAIQFAQNTAGGTSTILAGSSLQIWQPT